MIEIATLEKMETAMVILRQLNLREGPTLAFDVMDAIRADDRTVSYGALKSAMQQLRVEGVIVVVKDGPASKRNWIAYQTVWMAPHIEQWMMTDDVTDKRVNAAKDWVRKIGDKRGVVSLKHIDDADSMMGLRIGVAMGWLKLSAVVTDEGHYVTSISDDGS